MCYKQSPAQCTAIHCTTSQAAWPADCPGIGSTTRSAVRPVARPLPALALSPLAQLSLPQVSLHKRFYRLKRICLAISLLKQQPTDYNTLDGYSVRATPSSGTKTGLHRLASKCCCLENGNMTQKPFPILLLSTCRAVVDTQNSGTQIEWLMQNIALALTIPRTWFRIEVRPTSQEHSLKRAQKQILQCYSECALLASNYYSSRY